uniref:HIG1 domain-containing protein n=1 Tax=Scleropages formosus TaxID=113540 RepID=A0A8C9WUT6_SCLFO
MYLTVILQSTNDDTRSFTKAFFSCSFCMSGVAGCAATVAYGLYRLKSRWDTKMSMRLMRMRVAAQGFVVGAVAFGIVYTVYREYSVKPGVQEK